MKTNQQLYTILWEELTENFFLRQLKLSEEELRDRLEGRLTPALCQAFLDSTDSRGRFLAKDCLPLMEPVLLAFAEEPDEGWMRSAYQAILGHLFPEKQIPGEEAPDTIRGRLVFLQLLKGFYRFERQNLPFDPTVEMYFLSSSELAEGGYTREYHQLIRLADRSYLYEFMRLGVELTPFNTLGHIAGVHYVAMHAARQLAALNAPVDLGLISGAAAGHDIGKYGCRKSEERRIPYLHYYYTDLCFNRFGMPLIGHIAANHSTWDLELDNLSLESLLLIYADFRVKSSRNADGVEIVHFYSLDDSFDVILSKLDNVDAAKEHRYRKVYNKLKDFESYMIHLGVDTALPDVPVRVPQPPQAAASKDYALLRSSQVVDELKYLSIEHNIKLMHRFYSQEKFSGLLETARSEKHWINLRTYISILGEYSTYMTEKQKLMTLRFLSEFLVHKESDIRNQSGEIMGQIIARFNDEYKKELPEGVALPDKDITNHSLWASTLENILIPDHKLTDQHKKWIANSLKSVASTLLNQCKPEQRGQYLDQLLIWYRKQDLDERTKVALIQVALSIQPELCTQEQVQTFLSFTRRLSSEENIGLRVAAVGIRYHFGSAKHMAEYHREVKSCLGLDPDGKLSREQLSEMYLDNLKAGTPWQVKIANIQLMLLSLEESEGSDQVLHVATHLGNLVKVSETVVVRKSAGEALVSIIDKMPLEQRNEIAVELGKGLEIGDYQFSKYIPNYLGVIMLHLPPRELDELITDLTELLNDTNGQVAAAVLHTFGVVLENYHLYKTTFGAQESDQVRRGRKYKLVNLITKGLANYSAIISQEALWTLGQHIFGSDDLSLEDKYHMFCHCGKKVLTLYETRQESDLQFYNNAAVLKHIYRFICEYELEIGAFTIPEPEKVAFFPGTFDPFSLSHKAIATEIRNMGCEVYLALDEFSWSKKTQPRLQRRKILSMSIADEANLYIFPDDIPVNIANPADLAKLRRIFEGRELYFVAGSDVVENASCYRMEPEADSIHSMHHVIFKRSSDERRSDGSGSKVYPITGDIIHLHLEEYFEDISSTRIRENIDSNRDISNLIDPVAQNYIFENGLYMREPAYKHVLQSQDIQLDEFQKANAAALRDLEEDLREQGYDMHTLYDYFRRPGIKMMTIRDNNLEGKVAAVAGVVKIDSIDLLKTFGDQDIAAYIRSKAAGAIAVIVGLFTSSHSEIHNLDQILLVELLSELLARDYTYVVYHPCDDHGLKKKAVRTVKRQGFINIAGEHLRPIYAVDMRSPAIIFKNVNTLIKHPLNKSDAVLDAVEKAHNRLLNVLTDIYPGELILSYNSNIMYHKMIQLITRINQVDPVPYAEKRNGAYMAVPFGKVLQGSVVPNTVTKSLHTEKYFARDVSDFTIEEKGFYSTIENQIRTIKSFNRPIILVDDLLHKGYRMNEIDPILKANNVDVVDTVVGVQTGRGRDLMTIKERTVDSAYFLPNLKCWIDESGMYPYIGGDSIKDKSTSVANMEFITAMNLTLPFAVPTFLGDIPIEKFYEFSMTCLENARDILKTIEDEYQKVFERKLTLKRMGEIFIEPKNPDMFSHITFDESIAPSAFVEMDIEKLIRMRGLL